MGDSLDFEDERFSIEFDAHMEYDVFHTVDTPPSFFDRYFMRDLLKHAGRSVRIQLTAPLELLADVNRIMSSRSLFFTMAIERYFRRSEMLDTNIPALNQLFNVVLEQRRALDGGGSDDASYGAKIRARRAFFKRWRLAFDARIAELDALSKQANDRISDEVGPAANFGLFFGRHHVNTLFGHVGKVVRCQLAVPTYLLTYVDCVSDSRSLFMSMVVDDLLRRNRRRTGKAASIRELHRLKFDRWVASGGRDSQDAGYYDIFRTRHVYLKRRRRYVDYVTAVVSGASLEKKKLQPRIGVRRPYLRIRKSRTDSESERELGSESETWRENMRENLEAMRDLFHNNPELFKEKFPDTYDDWYSESDAAYEEEEEEPLGN